MRSTIKSLVDHSLRLLRDGVAVALLLLLCLPGSPRAEILTHDTRWSGEVTLTEDLLIPRGVTLTVEAGTRVTVAQALSTKTEPAFWNPDTEIAVEGRLVVEGREEAPVAFVPEEGGRWGGLIAAAAGQDMENGGEIVLRHVTLVDADEALVQAGGQLDLAHVRVERANYGLLVIMPNPEKLVQVSLVDCKVGVVGLGENSPNLPGVMVVNAKDAERLYMKMPDAPPPQRPASFFNYPHANLDKVLVREYVGEYTVEGHERWSGVIVVNGRVTVPPESMLTLEPGTRVRFRKLDTNGDGLGEGELLVLGSIRSLGTKDAPVVFESAEELPRAGDWDKVSLISSEDPDNLFEYTHFWHGVQALHAHFSSLTARNCRFGHNLRAVQFQESERAEVSHSVFLNNKQALRFRDSTVYIDSNDFLGNFYAVHAFRTDLLFTDNWVDLTSFGGVLAKESQVKVRGNLFSRNRNGLRAKGEGSKLLMESNRIELTLETAISLSGVEAKLTGNTLDKAGLDLLGLESSTVVLRKNQMGGSGRHAIHLKDDMEVDARYNDWSSKEPSQRIYDINDNPELGRVQWKPALQSGQGVEVERLP